MIEELKDKLKSSTNTSDQRQQSVSSTENQDEEIYQRTSALIVDEVDQLRIDSKSESEDSDDEPYIGNVITNDHIEQYPVCFHQGLLQQKSIEQNGTLDFFKVEIKEEMNDSLLIEYQKNKE